MRSEQPRMVFWAAGKSKGGSATTKRGGKTTAPKTTARAGGAKSTKAKARAHIKRSSGAGRAKAG